MTWSKIDDQARKHPKCRRAGNFATLLWRCSIDWSNQYHTDGFIPADEVRDLTPVPLSHKQAAELSRRLVECRITRTGPGLWEIAEGGFLIHDFAEFNPSSSEDEDRRRADRERKRVERERLARRRLQNGTAQKTPDGGRRPAGQAPDVPKDVQPDNARTSDGRPDTRPTGVRSPRAGAGARAGVGDPVPSRPVPSEEEQQQTPGASGTTPTEKIDLALRERIEFSALDSHAVASVIEGRRMAKGTRLEDVLSAIADCADDSAGQGLKPEALQRKLRAYCDNAKPKIVKMEAPAPAAPAEWVPEYNTGNCAPPPPLARRE